MATRDRTSYAPNGSVDAAVNGRVTREQLDYLKGLADELNTTLSGALRRAIDQSRLYEVASGRVSVDGGGDEPVPPRYFLDRDPVVELDQADDPS